MRRNWLWWLAGSAAVLLVLVVASCAQRRVGFYSPVYSADGRHVYFVQRSTSGIAIGLGWEHFTPPAHAYIWADRFDVCRVSSDGSGFEVIERLPPSPLQGTVIEEYRGRIFRIPSVVLWFTDGNLEYGVSIRGRSGQQVGIVKGAREWTTRYVTLGSGDDVLREPWEVLSIRGEEGFPCAVAAYNDRTKELRVLRETGDCDVRNPDLSGLRAPGIRRLLEIRRLNEQFVAEGQAAGLLEGEAMLAASRKLQDLGYYPRPAHLVARPVTRGAETPRVSLTEEGFHVGLFPDVLEAIRHPGKEVPKSMGRYLRHDWIKGSEELNDLLASGADVLYVDTERGTFEIRIIPARPAKP